MIQYEIQIKEKQKFIRKLSFLNLRDEIVNFMYKQTITRFSREDLKFFVLIFFLATKLKDEKNSLLYNLFANHLDKLSDLNVAFSNKKTYLKKGEYRKIVEELKLENVLKNDIIFLLVESVRNIVFFKIEYADFFKENPKLLEEFNFVGEKFGDEIENFYTVFKDYDIEDDRIDNETGEYLDLSKSVYRTIKMRSRRKLDIALQQFTTIHKIKSESPLILQFLQSVEIQIILELWDKYYLIDYVKNVFNLPINNFLDFIDPKFNIVDLIGIYHTVKGLSKKTEKKEKKIAIQKLEKEKRKLEKNNNTLLNALSISLQNTPDSLIKEIQRLKRNLQKMERNETISKNEKKVTKALEKEIRNLENIEILIQKKK